MASGVLTRLCTYCGEEKSWLYSGKKLKDGSKIYVNHETLRWAGRRCPDCERSRVQAAIRCDSFEREAIIQQLKAAGYTVQSKTLPIKAEKDGQVYTVGIRHAYTDEGAITLDKAPVEKADIYALVFNSVRICTAEQMGRLETTVTVYERPRGKSPDKSGDVAIS